jgi:hypothetical protein
MSSGSPSSAIRRVTPHSPMAYTECQSKQLGSGGHLLPAHRRQRRVWCFHFAGSPRCQPNGGQTRAFAAHSSIASRISRDVARSSCLDLGDPTFVPQARRVEPCRPRALRSLARIGGLVWSSGEYNSRWVLAPGDTEEEREIVLYRPEELRSVRLVLKALRPPDANTDALVAVDECVNGTGGCAQTFMSYRDGHGKGVVRQFEDSLRQRFPGAINHGYHVDLASMRFEASVFSPRDANCCPSHVAVGAVTFRGDTLRLASLRLRDAVNK